MIEKLRPCPFCGGEATAECKGGVLNIFCRECGCGTRNRKPGHEDAVDAWNARAEAGLDPVSGSRCPNCAAVIEGSRITDPFGYPVPLNYCPNCGERM